MAKKKRRITDEDVRRSFPPGFLESFEPTNRLLAERVAEFHRKAAERRARGESA